MISKQAIREATYVPVAAFCFLYFLLFYTFVPIHIYHAFGVMNFDFGVLFQSTYLLSAAKPLFLSTRGVHAWADNQDYFQVVLSLLHHFPGSPYSLLIVHSLALFACGVFCYLYLENKDRVSALAVAVSVWLSPFLINANLDLFHTEAFATIFLLLIYYSCKTGRPSLFYLFLMGALSCKEDVALTVGSFMILAFISHRGFKLNRYHYGTGLLIAMVVLFVNLKIVLPFFKVQTCLWFDHEAAIGSMDSAPVSSAFRDILSNWYRPLYVASALARDGVGWYLLLLLWPMVFLLNRRPLFFLLVLPGAMVNILSKSGYFSAGYYHYDHCTTAAVIMAVLEGLAGHTRKRTVSLLMLATAICIVGFVANLRTPVTAGFTPDFYRLKKRTEVRFLERLNDALSEDTVISADYTSINYLIKGHPELYMFENPFRTTIGFGIRAGCNTFDKKPLVDLIIVRNDYDIDADMEGLLSREYGFLPQWSGLFRVWVRPSFLNSPKSDKFRALLTEAEEKDEACRSTNLLQNGSFELTAFDKPAFWTLVSREKLKRLTACVYETAPVGKDGLMSANITHREINSARWSQRVAVKPHHKYRLSGWIKTDDATKTGTDAYIQAETFRAASGSVSKPFPWQRHTVARAAASRKPSVWQYVEVKFHTGENQKILFVVCGLGEYETGVSGTAYFDDIRLTRTSCLDEIFGVSK